MPSIRHWFVAAALAALGILSTPTLPDVLSVAGPAAAKDVYTCMTDDGYGRYRPCSAGYKAANPGWRGSEACMTDDGYGRYRPCSAGYKAKHKK